MVTSKCSFGEALLVGVPFRAWHISFRFSNSGLLCLFSKEIKTPKSFPFLGNTCFVFNPKYYGNIMAAHWIITFLWNITSKRFSWGNWSQNPTAQKPDMVKVERNGWSLSIQILQNVTTLLQLITLPAPQLFNYSIGQLHTQTLDFYDHRCSSSHIGPSRGGT